MANPCTRCGNERVAGKTWKEIVDFGGRKTTLTHTDWVCTDPKCQKIVENQLFVQKEKRVGLERQKAYEKEVRAKSAIAARIAAAQN